MQALPYSAGAYFLDLSKLCSNVQDETHSEATMRYEYLNDEAVAKLFGVAVSTVKRWRLEGRLGFTRIGPRRVGIRREDVDAFIKSGEQPAKAA